MGLIEHVQVTGSTNADIALRLREGEPLAEGHWLVADRQNAGRGRHCRDWFDGAGNFMGSTLVRIGPGDPQPSSLAFVAGLAVYETVRGLLADAAGLSLKWPNDLMLDGTKLAGILLEREGDAVIVGVGVNLARAPALPDRRTIALGDVGPAPDRNAFAQSLVQTFAAELANWRRNGLEPLFARWGQVAHPPGTPLTVQTPGEETVRGAFAGLAADGALCLRLADGAVRVIHAGDVFA